MSHVSDEHNRGRPHRDYSPDYRHDNHGHRPDHHPSKRERDRVRDRPYDHRDDEESDDAREERRSRTRGRSENRHRKRSVTPYRPRHSHSAGSPGATDHRRKHGDRHLLTAEQRQSIKGRLAEKAIGTAAVTAYRLRHSEGSWVGRKGLRVVGAAVTTAALDGLFDPNPKKHVLQHLAVSMVEGAVMDAFATLSPHGEYLPGKVSHGH